MGAITGRRRELIRLFSGETQLPEDTLMLWRHSAGARRSAPVCALLAHSAPAGLPGATHPHRVALPVCPGGRESRDNRGRRRVEDARRRQGLTVAETERVAPSFGYGREWEIRTDGVPRMQKGRRKIVRQVRPG